ncbi:unnamed protein product [Caenorhabditis auriculariae]|uniref:Guanylate cyclase n=1 Tax=Caenorhabditis auriculariae TaxID=2777116 RepID=A0A8S1HCW3_9PELO|nr:unnamed protein product [Caenorhabditis auriculariae]
MLVIGRLAPRWNVPIIAHMSGDDALSDRNEFPTLGSVALTSASEMAKATVTYLQLNNWDQVGIVRPTVNYERLSAFSLINICKKKDIQLNVMIEIDPISSVEEILSSGKLLQLQNAARIIVVEIGMDLHAVTNFMVAVHRAKMKTEEFVFILPWLAHVHDHYPWEADKLDKQEVKAAFEHSVIITAHGYDNKFFQEFQKKFSAATGMLATHYATLSYMSLYDALFLYGLALRDAYEAVGGYEVHQNGSLLWSMMTNRSQGSKQNGLIAAKQAISNGVRVAIKRYRQLRNLSFPKNELRMLKELKMIENDNLNKFYGISFNQQNEFIVMWVLCSRGSLEDILFNDELKLGRNFQVSFAKDVVKGLSFLHASPIGCHGMLCLQNCLVDSNWTVKLSNFATEQLISEKLDHSEIKPIECESESEVNEEKMADISSKKYLQQAPEIIREVMARKCLPKGTQAADVYALGMVLYQILFRVEPFHERGKSVYKLLEKLAMSNDEEQIIRPVFPSSNQNEGYSLQLLSCLEATWLELAEMRPNVKKVRAMVNANLKSSGKGSLVDQMMKMMEEYTMNLESMVRDRTAMLEEAQKQADRLLNSMLPRSIADDLKVGKPVLPQLYSSATVLFSDIRGFTRISSTSTPLQVVTFLNDMFSGFDAIIAKHDAYKVETIGDAYMIVSGVPTENGNAHVQNIADISLKMRAFISNFKLAHRPEEVMMVRIGFHSGTVAAGVVGLAAPRYCLFGDTVNTASRMESTGVANKIQISESSYNLLHCFYSQFIIVERGKIEVKGKGECTTFYLEGKNNALVKS